MFSCGWNRAESNRRLPVSGRVLSPLSYGPVPTAGLEPASSEDEIATLPLSYVGGPGRYTATAWRRSIACILRSVRW